MGELWVISILNILVYIIKNLKYTANEFCINEEPLKSFSKRMTRLKLCFRIGLAAISSLYWSLYCILLIILHSLYYKALEQVKISL